MEDVAAPIVAPDAPAPVPQPAAIEAPFGDLSWLDRVDPSSLPPIRTLRNIPRCMRRRYAVTYAEVCAGCQLEGQAGERAHKLRLLLPRLLLAAPTRSRGGRKGQARRAKLELVGDRLDRLYSGRGRDLLSVARAMARSLKTSRGAPVEDEVLFAEVLRLVSLDELSRAMALLGSEGAATANAATFELFRSKVATEPPAHLLVPPPPPSPAFVEEARRVLTTHLPRALSSSPKGSAAGASGDRFEFLRPLQSLAPEHLDAINRTFTDIALGCCPEFVMEAMRTARGFALKKGEGIRPLAAQEPLRRLLTRAILKGATRDLRAALEPLQLAVAVEGGAEVLGRSVQVVAESHPTWIILKADLKHAFGSAKRRKALDFLQQHCPLLERHLASFLHKPTRYIFEMQDGEQRLVESPDGVDQGDPAGPALFCACIADTLAALQADIRTRLEGAHPDAFIGAYMDDVFLVVPPALAQPAMTAVADRFRSLGMSLAEGEDKSGSTSIAGTAPPDLQVRFSEDGIQAAGVAVFARSRAPVLLEIALKETLEESEGLAKQLEKLCSSGPAGRPRRASAFKLLANCLQQKFAHHARSAPASEELSAAALRFDETIASTARFIISSEGEIPETSVAQIHEPVVRGGFGISRQEPSLNISLVSSAVLTIAGVRSATGLAHMGTNERDLLPCEQEIQAAANDIAGKDWKNVPLWECLAGRMPSRGWGHSASRALAAQSTAQLKADLADDASALARLRSCSGPGSWILASSATGDAREPRITEFELDGPPQSYLHPASLNVGDDEFVACCRMRLGLRCGGRTGTCNRKTSTRGARKLVCLEPLAGAIPKHALTCPCGPWARKRHDCVARELQRLILEIEGAAVSWVPKVEGWPQAGGAPGEPDLVVHVPGWRALYLDVAIVWPSGAGDAAKEAEAEKVAKYPVWIQRSRSRSCDFEPAVFEAYGRAGPKSAAIIRKLAARCALDHGLRESSEIRRWRETLSTRLAVEQARIILNG